MGRVLGSPRRVILVAGAIAIAIGVFAVLRFSAEGPFFDVDAPASPTDDAPPAEAGLPSSSEAQAHLAGRSDGRPTSVADMSGFGRVHARIVRGVDRAPVPGVPVMVEVLVNGARRTKAIGWSNDLGEALVEKIPPGSGYLVRIQPASQRAVDRTDVVVKAGETLDLGDVVLGAMGIIDGIVLDEAREPLKDVHIALTLDPETVLSVDRDPWPLAPDPPSTFRRLETDDRGRFRLEGVPPGLAAVRATLPGRRGATHRVMVPAQGPQSAFTVFILPPGVPLLGVVLDAGGQPAANALVEAGTDGLAAFEPRTESHTDIEGRFVMLGFRGLRSADVRVTPADPRDGTAVVFRARQVGVPHTLRLVRGARLVVTVRDEGTREPIAEARVDAAFDVGNTALEPQHAHGTTGWRDEAAPAVDPFASARRSATTDAEGKVTLEVPDGGYLHLEIRRRGYRPLFIKPRQGRGRRETIVMGDVDGRFANGETRLLDVSLRRARTLRGVVSDDSGPVRSAVVTVRPGGDEAPETHVTDTDGRFEFEYVVPERGATIAVRTHGGGFLPERRVDGSGGARVVGEEILMDLHLMQGAVVTGRVVDSAGNGVAGARVHTSLGDLSAWTDGDGRYRLKGIPIARHPKRPNVLALEATAEGLGRGTYSPLQIWTEEEVVAPDLVLGMGGEIRGVVLDAKGNRARFPVLDLVDLATGEVWRTQAAEEFGDFILRAVPPGRYRVRARTQGTCGASQEREIDDWTGRSVPPFTEIRLVPFREVTGQVLAAEGAPVQGVRIRMSVRGSAPASADPTLELVEAVSDTEGHFELSTFRVPASLEVEARHHRKIESDASIELTGGSETVEVRLKGPPYLYR